MKFAKSYNNTGSHEVKWRKDKLSNSLSLSFQISDTPKTWSFGAWCRNWRFPWHPFSNPVDLIRNLIPRCEAVLRDHPTDLTPLHTALSMLSPIARGNQTGNKAGVLEGGGIPVVAGAAATLAPPGPSLGRGLWDPSQSILIDRGGNYISLAFSANPHGPAGDTKRETKRMRGEKIE